MKNLKKSALLIVCLFFATVLFASPLELIDGKLKLVLYPDTGSFSLYQLSEIGKNRYEPLFEDRNAGTTTWFSVLSNGRVFKLARKAGKTIIAEQTALGAKLVFTLTDDFQVEQEFSFVKNPVSGNPSAVRIDTRIENTSGKVAVFALKALFDTMLGESEGIHFYTNIRKRISAETRFLSSVDTDSVLVSQNKDVSCMFLLQGFGSTRADTVFVSNWDRLNTLTWVPEFIEERSFNTVYSINDSALLFVWPEKSLKANEKLVVTMIMGPYSPSFITTTPVVVTKTPSANQVLIQQLLDRISVIQANPSSASDEELQKLNNALDIMLKQIEE